MLPGISMSFRLLGLDPSQFAPLYGLTDADLQRHGARRYAVNESPGYPDRIEVRDARPGETVLLLNYVHQPADTPYRASHAIFVREYAVQSCDVVNEIPDALRIRLISLRAFNERHDMIEADVVEGARLEAAIARFLENPCVAYLHAHYAKQGCYAARIERA